MLTGRPTNMVKAFLIEPLEEKITEVELDASRMWEALKEKLGHVELTSVAVPGRDHAFVCDDIALLRENPDQYGYFQPSFRDYPMCGKALLVGTDSHGNLVDVQMTELWLREHIDFPKVRYTGTLSVNKEIEHPIFGTMFQIINIPQFARIDKKDMN